MAFGSRKKSPAELPPIFPGEAGAHLLRMRLTAAQELATEARWGKFPAA
jgi:hypothetical protein